MWITENVDIPDEIITSQEEDRLVIFAGAGVSMGAPSNYPDFVDLASQIADRELTEKNKKQIDVFLGNLKQQGVKVHKRTKEILTNPESKPNLLHENIVKLFKTPDKLRIVTTNFDNHFNTVSKEFFDEQPNIFYAPALPLGRKFSGIVYLHGCVEQNADDLVVTDSDFGRAYITDGWASRFLIELFQNFAVLFIGYSHNDLVLKYLARGLPPNTNRYALVEKNASEHWEFLGIKAIEFPNDDNTYSELYEVINNWKEEEKSGVYDKRTRIIKIVSEGPPEKNNEHDFIVKIINDSITVKIFCKYAQDIKWLNWVENLECFNSLFEPNTNLKDYHYCLIEWFVDNFLIEYSMESLALIQRQGLKMHPYLWQSIARKLNKNFKNISSKKINKWVTMLLNNKGVYNNFGLLESILSKCKFPNDKNTAILLFGYLIRPNIKLTQSLTVITNKEVDFDVILNGDENYLIKSWEKFFKPYLCYFADRLESIITNSFLLADIQLRALSKKPYFDSLNFSRESISKDSDKSFISEFDVVIDAARDIIEYYINNYSSKAINLIEKWSNLEPLLLKRIAIHGMLKIDKFEPNDKINWILKNNFLHEYGLDKEVHKLLVECYPKSSEDIRRKVIKATKNLPDYLTEIQNKEQQREYTLNELFRLQKIAPECDITKSAYERYRSNNPDVTLYKDKYEKKELDGDKFIEVEELLEMSPETIIDKFISLKEEEGEINSSFLQKISKAALKDFDWSLDLAIEIKQKAEVAYEMWDDILFAWAHSNSIPQDKWIKILILIDEFQSFINKEIILDILLKYINSQKDLNEQELELCESIASNMYEPIYEWELDQESECRDFFEYAYTHLGGKLARFWINGLLKRNYYFKESWSDLPECYIKFFNSIIKFESKTAETAGIVILSKLHIIFNINPKWTEKELIPLLNWNTTEHAIRFWSGFLFNRKLNKGLVSKILPHIIKSFSKLSNELSTMKREFCNHLANITVYYNLDNWNMLRKFIKNADEESHIQWLKNVKNIFNQKLNEEQIINNWESWLKEYWQKRNDGIPKRFSDKEKVEMVEFSILLKPVFAQAVDNICSMEIPQIKYPRIYKELLDNSFVSTFPENVVNLLLHLIPQTKMNPYCCENIKDIIIELEDKEVSPDCLNEIIEKATDKGCLNLEKRGNA